MSDTLSKDRPMPMHSWLRWSLAASALASVVASYWPDDVTEPPARGEDSASDSSIATDRTPALSSVSSTDHSAAGLPEHLPALALQETDQDPFLGKQAAPPPAPKGIVEPVAIPPPPPAPSPPQLNYRYLGQMVDPMGKTLIYLASADREVAVAVGSQLDGGYVVEAVAADEILVVYPPLDAHAVIKMLSGKDVSIQ